MASTASPRNEPGFGATPLAERELVFHTPEWEALVEEVYGFESLAIRRPGAVLPIFRTRGLLSGSRLVSAVFNGYAGPLFADSDAADALVAEAADHARSRGVDWLELRGLGELPDAIVARHGLLPRTPYRHSSLGCSEVAAGRGYERKFRKNLRVARRLLAAAGVRIEPGRRVAELRGFHDVLVRMVRDRHGSMTQPWRLFDAVRRRFLESDSGDLWLARGARGEILGGALFLTHAGVATGAWGATRAVDGRWCLDSVIKDAAIQHYAGRGFDWIDFGLSSPHQAGLLFAKARFGAVTRPTPWYYLPVRAREIPERDFADAHPWLRRVWRHVPVPLAKSLSSWLASRLG